MHNVSLRVEERHSQNGETLHHLQTDWFIYFFMGSGLFLCMQLLIFCKFCYRACVLIAVRDRITKCLYRKVIPIVGVNFRCSLQIQNIFYIICRAVVGEWKNDCLLLLRSSVSISVPACYDCHASNTQIRTAYLGRETLIITNSTLR